MWSRLSSSCRPQFIVAAGGIFGGGTVKCDALDQQADHAPRTFSTHANTRITLHKDAFEPTKVQDSGCLVSENIMNSPYADAWILPKPDWRPLPTYSLHEVRHHSDHNPNETWVTYKGGVYDMTTFLDCHPGGAGRINMVQGSDLKPFWKVYELHQRPHILNLLEHYRIGNLTPEDAKKAEEDSEFSNYYEEDPQRSAAAKEDFNIPSLRPWNSEPPRKKLVESFYTPNDLFFVRNHNSVPKIADNEYELEIEENPLIGLKGRTFTLRELKEKFPRQEVHAALQCAGNRQEDFVVADRPLYVAPHWTGAAIGCAKWGGVLVRDVLRECGLDVDNMALGKVVHPDCKIVNFVGYDEDECGTPYAGVLPAAKVIDPYGDALLAYDMNDETLPRDHGFPIRLLAPGHAGCRNVKWVKQIIVSSIPSDLDSGSKLDRHFDSSVSFMNHLRFGDDYVRLEMGPVIQTLPVTSVICSPSSGEELEVVKEKYVTVQGIAYSGGGRGVCRVELSIDGGETFQPAELWGIKPSIAPEAGQGRNWAWVQFEKNIELPPHVVENLKKGEQASIEICARAVDGDFNSQPERMNTVYNSLGICANHWDRVNVKLLPTPRTSKED